MDENRNILGLEECEDTDDCMKLSLDDDIGDDFEELWDAADEDEFDECAPCKRKAKKRKRLIIIAVACVAAAVTAFIIYKLVKNSKKSN